MTVIIGQRLILSVLRRVFAKQCLQTVPRSGREGEAIDCFKASSEKNGKPYLLLDSLDGDLIKCRRWDGNSYSIDMQERLSNLVDGELHVVHYYGLTRIDFTGPWDFLWHRYSRFIYIWINIRRAKEGAAQFLFNRRSLRSQQRLRILRILVSARLTGDLIENMFSPRGLTSFDVMTELYSNRWVNHPDHETRQTEVGLQLEALAASGDVVKSNITYTATPKSIATLEQAEEQDRRHREAFRLQLWIVILTFIIALSALVQAGLVSLPTLLDLRGK